MSDLKAKFEEAAEKARVVQGVSNDDKLKLYGLFKQATQGPIGDRARPSLFSPTERAKFDAWAAFDDIDKQTAMTEYVALVATL
ncbi:unnamed protein product [Cylindrotheca closterium]|uniref:ACB domain-containing protein n=1 Tax=Cylindrotheca closterium TaxID=2856 RepID=A0AAD2PUR0_9STRA|nr:unnamed protein product [Cylindrotheca closterium]